MTEWIIPAIFVGLLVKEIYENRIRPCGLCGRRGLDLYRSGGSATCWDCIDHTRAHKVDTDD